MISRLTRKIRHWRSFRKLPAFEMASPTEREKSWIRELREAFSKVETSQEELYSAGSSWPAILARLKKKILAEDPRRFLQWDIIRYTMFVDDAYHVFGELNFLRGLADYRNRWYPALQESAAGSPNRYAGFDGSSGNLVHQAHHAGQLENHLGLRVDSLDVVLEIGGGYGCMCRLFRQLGFMGTYIIYDLPPMSALQRFYLRLARLDVDENSTPGQIQGIYCTSDADKLSGLISALNPEEQNSLLQAYWSLSEIPLQSRGEIETLLPRFRHLALGYQDNYYEVDNAVYFERLPELSGLNIKNAPLPGLDGNHYLFASRNGK